MNLKEKIMTNDKITSRSQSNKYFPIKISTHLLSCECHKQINKQTKKTSTSILLLQLNQCLKFI